MKRVYATGLLLCLVVFCAHAVAVGPITIDWETEDDFTTPLINGQSIGTLSGLPGETVFEFGDLINVSSTSVYFKAHLGPAIFDSDTGGPNDGGGARVRRGLRPMGQGIRYRVDCANHRLEMPQVHRLRNH